MSHTPADIAAPLRFQVLGERSSGTNFVKRLIGRNSDLRPTEALGWKHGFAQMTAIPADLAVICVVREPRSWVLSMHSKPWHTPGDMQALEFSDFIRAPWNTIIDRPRYFGPAEQNAQGMALQQDRDPLTGATFANIFALRQAKLRYLTSVLNRNCTCVMLRVEQAQSAPQQTLDMILNALGRPTGTEGFKPVIKHLGAKFKPAIANRPATPETISPDDLAFMSAQLDTDQEAALGYNT